MFGYIVTIHNMFGPVAERAPLAGFNHIADAQKFAADYSRLEGRGWEVKVTCPNGMFFCYTSGKINKLV
jgi:hypothetical protein